METRGVSSEPIFNKLPNFRSEKEKRRLVPPFLDGGDVEHGGVELLQRLWRRQGRRLDDDLGDALKVIGRRLKLIPVTEDDEVGPVGALHHIHLMFRQLLQFKIPVNMYIMPKPQPHHTHSTHLARTDEGATKIQPSSTALEAIHG